MVAARGRENQKNGGMGARMPDCIETVVIDARDGITTDDLRIVTSNTWLRFVLITKSDPYGSEHVAAAPNAGLISRVCEHLRVGDILFALSREIPARVQDVTVALDTPLIDYQSAIAELIEIERLAREARHKLESPHVSSRSKQEEPGQAEKTAQYDVSIEKNRPSTEDRRPGAWLSVQTG